MKTATLLGFAAAVCQAVTLETPANVTYYYFKSSVKSGQAAEKSQYNNIYLGSAHTGAGFGDAVFWNRSDSSRGWFNGTYLKWNVPQGYGVSFELASSSSYDAWTSVQICGACTHTAGLKLDENKKLVYEGQDKSYFKSWLVCDWIHGFPQLFILKDTNVGNSAKIPATCAKIDIVAE